MKAVIYEIDYIAYEDGRIFSNKSSKFLSGSISHYGYNIVSIHGKGVKRHRIIAECFIENPFNKPMVNHKDGDKSNNCANNLEWMTNSENMKHGWEMGLMKRGENHGVAKYTDQQIMWVCEQLSNGLSCQKISDVSAFDISRARVLGIRSRRDWKHISENYSWKVFK